MASSATSSLSSHPQQAGLQGPVGQAGSGSGAHLGVGVGVGASSVQSNGASPHPANYFYLSDLAQPVALKIRAAQGPLHALARSRVFDESTRTDELELYVSVSIWSRGAPIGLPASTAYRAAPSPYTAGSALPNSSNNNAAANGGHSASVSSPMSGGGSISGPPASAAPGSPYALVAGPSISTVKWNSWLQFPVQYRDLDHASRFGITVWCVAHGTAVSTGKTGGPPTAEGEAHPHRCACKSDSRFSSQLGVHSRLFAVGGCSLPIFNKRGLLKLGRRKLFLHSGVEGDPQLGSNFSADTDPATAGVAPGKHSAAQSLEKLEKLLREFECKDASGGMGSLGGGGSQAPAPPTWLDKLAMRRIQKIQQNTAQVMSAESDLGLGGASSESAGADAMQLQLHVEFPAFKHPIVFHQKTYGAPLRPIQPESILVPAPPTTAESGTSSTPSTPATPAVSVAAPQPPPSHPQQQPQQVLALNRDRLFILHDPEINNLNPIEHAFHKMARSTKGGLFQRDLKPTKKEREEILAIISSPNKKLNIEAKEMLWKFRFSLTDDQRAVTKFLRCVTWSDVEESKQALELLGEWGNIEVADALELLSSAFPHEGVRAYAVKQLQRADHEELSNYLLQLVQALRYEQTVPSFLSDFLITRACQSMSLANFFHWYLCVEVHDAKKGSMYALVLKGFMEALARQDKAQQQDWVEMLEQQGRLIQQLIALGDAAKVNKGRVEKKVERMRLLLQPDGDFKALRSFQQPIRLSVRPEIAVTGLIGEESTMFKSALAPILACFTISPSSAAAAAGGIGSASATPASPPPASATASAGPGAAVAVEKYKVIFKSGDDLRQDQLVIQMINLMDTLLKKVKLDLQLTPYRVLATGPGHGFVEFVPNSHTLTSILDRFEKVASNTGTQNNPIGKFFEHYNPKPQTLAKVLDTFVKSCAGYCVITYLLGIGDRHLENVMLTQSGNLFHIDFSFIFGRDPKPFPPPMKFSKEMVEAMGGSNSGQYQDFRRYCCLAFNILRQHANLILNLLSLMGDANIPDLSSDVEKNLYKVQEKFRLDLSDTEADGYIQALIDQSVSALFPQVLEKIHKWALYWRSFSLSSSLLLFDGTSVPVGDVAVGALLRGSDDAPVRVTAAYRGTSTHMYRLLYDGGEHTVTPEHLVVLRCGLSPSVQTMTHDGESVLLQWLDELWPAHYSQLGWRFTPPRFAQHSEDDVFPSSEAATLAARRYGGWLLQQHGPNGDKTLLAANVHERRRGGDNTPVTDVRITARWSGARGREDILFPFGVPRRRGWPVLPKSFLPFGQEFALWYLEQLAARHLAHPLRCGSMFEAYAELIYRARDTSVFKRGNYTLPRDASLARRAPVAAASAASSSSAATPSASSSSAPAEAASSAQEESDDGDSDADEEDAEAADEYELTPEERAARRLFDMRTMSMSDELAQQFAALKGIPWQPVPRAPSVKETVTAALAQLGNAEVALAPMAGKVRGRQLTHAAPDAALKAEILLAYNTRQPNGNVTTIKMVQQQFAGRVASREISSMLAGKRGKGPAAPAAPAASMDDGDTVGSGPITPEVMAALAASVSAAQRTPSARRGLGVEVSTVSTRLMVPSGSGAGHSQLSYVQVGVRDPPMQADFVYMLHNPLVGGEADTVLNAQGSKALTIAQLERARSVAGVPTADARSVIVELNPLAADTGVVDSLSSEFDAVCVASLRAALAMQPLAIIAFGQYARRRWQQHLARLPRVSAVRKLRRDLWLVSVAGVAEPVRLAFAVHPCVRWGFSSVVRAVHAAHGLTTVLTDDMLNSESAGLCRFDIERVDGQAQYAGVRVDVMDGRFMLADGVLSH